MRTHDAPTTDDALRLARLQELATAILPPDQRHALALTAVNAALPSCHARFNAMVKRGVGQRPLGGLVLWVVQALCELATLPSAASEAIGAQCALLQWLHPWAVKEEEALARSSKGL